MKTLSFELSKRLNELKLLDNIETKFLYSKKWKIYDKLETGPYTYGMIKTLTLEEAIEFLPEKIIDAEWGWINRDWAKWSRWPCNIWFNFFKEIRNQNEWIIWKIQIKDFDNCELDLVVWKTLLERIEKMIEYLLDNNLLTK